jgi:hypothetical protein
MPKGLVTVSYLNHRLFSEDSRLLSFALLSDKLLAIYDSYRYSRANVKRHYKHFESTHHSRDSPRSAVSAMRKLCLDSHPSFESRMRHRGVFSVVVGPPVSPNYSPGLCTPGLLTCL